MAKKEEVKKEPGKKERLSVTQLKTLLKRTGSEGLFTCYATFPPNTYFESQEQGEEVVLFLRQHLIVNIPWVTIVVFLLTIPSIFGFFPPFAQLSQSYQLIIVLTWYLFVTGYAMTKLMGWFFNIYILTDERIVDIDFVNVLFRKVSTAKIDEIQDVNVVASGALQTFFNYGGVFIQTAATVPEFDFVNIPHPDKVSAIINQMIDLEEQEQLEGRIK